MKPSPLAYLLAAATFSLSLTTIACGSSAQHPDPGTGGSSSGGTGGSGGGGGGSVGSGTCGKVAPCGGDLVGSWTLTESCVDLGTQSPTCPDERIASWTSTVSGNWTFNADLTYSRSDTLSAVVVWTIPLSCVSSLASSCADFEAQTQASLKAGETIACTGTTTCSCTESVGPKIETDNGTYEATGTNVAYTSAVTGTTERGSYCVEGSRVHFVALKTGAANSIASDVVGTKP
jgi:hypothetical protein